MENLLDHIAPVKALEIESVVRADGGVELHAPLEPNCNDKGSAFAGSLSSLLVLAGWATVTRRLQAETLAADVMVVESQTRFLRPARSDLRSDAELADLEGLLTSLRAKARGRIEATCQVYSGGELCAEMTASYAVFLRK